MRSRCRIIGKAACVGEEVAQASKSTEVLSADKVNKAKELLSDFLGEGASVKTNDFGDKILFQKMEQEKLDLT